MVIAAGYVLCCFLFKRFSFCFPITISSSYGRAFVSGSSLLHNAMVQIIDYIQCLSEKMSYFDAYISFFIWFFLPMSVVPLILGSGLHFVIFDLASAAEQLFDINCKPAADIQSGGN